MDDYGIDKHNQKVQDTHSRGPDPRYSYAFPLMGAAGRETPEM
jgi:hypothetical protein